MELGCGSGGFVLSSRSSEKRLAGALLLNAMTLASASAVFVAGRGLL